MRTWAKGTAARAALLTAGFVALGAGPVFPTGAFADATNGESSVLGGNQVNAPISAPIDVSGNAVAVAGLSGASSQGGSKVVNGGGGGGQTTSGKSSVLGGNQVNAPISAPINACGNSVAIIGAAKSGCTGGAKVRSGGGSGQATSGRSGVGSGNQVNAPVSAPVNACGNGVALVGLAGAACEGGAKVTDGGGSGGGGQGTSGAAAVLSGNQANAPISAPVSACGNAVGNALAACQGGAKVTDGGSGGGGQGTSGVAGVLSGNQANAPVAAPISICGNAAAVVGQTGAFCEGGAHARSGSGSGQGTSGVGGVGAGNQANAPVSVPANVCGNAAALIGVAAAACDGTAKVTGPQGPGGSTSGHGSVGGGNQANTPAEVPANVCGNAAAVLGHSEPVCQDDGYGYGPGYRTAGPRPGAAPLTLPLTDVTKKAALPGLPVAPSLDAARAVDGHQPPADMSTLPAGTKQVGGLSGALPGGPAHLPVITKGGTGQAPGAPSYVHKGKGKTTTKKGSRPAERVVADQRTRPQASAGKPAGTVVPGAGEVKLPQLPVAGKPGAPEANKDLSVKPVSARAPLSDDSAKGWPWALGGLAMLTAMAGVPSLVRRLVPSRG